MKNRRKTMRKSLPGIILTGILAAALTGCGGSEGELSTSGSYGVQQEETDKIEIPDGQELKADYTTVKDLKVEKGTYIAMVLKDLDNPYWKAVKEGAEKAVEELNASLGYTGEDQVRLTVDGVQGRDGENVDSQIDTIDAVLAENPAALCLAVIDRESCTAQLEAASESDIPVIILDSGMQNQDVGAAAVCMTDNQQAAAEAARKLCGELGEKGQIAVFAHGESSETSRERAEGFCSEVQEKYPQMEIVRVAYETEEGLPVAETLEQYPDLRGIFCTSATVTEQVLEELGNTQENKILVAGFDANADQLRAIREGKLFGTVCQNPRGMGYVSVTAALRAVSGFSMDFFIDTGYVWLDQGNIDDESNQKYLYDGI